MSADNCPPTVHPGARTVLRRCPWLLAAALGAILPAGPAWAVTLTLGETDHAGPLLAAADPLPAPAGPLLADTTSRPEPLDLPDAVGPETGVVPSGASGPVLSLGADALLGGTGDGLPAAGGLLGGSDALPAAPDAGLPTASGLFGTPDVLGFGSSAFVDGAHSARMGQSARPERSSPGRFDLAVPDGGFLAGDRSAVPAVPDTTAEPVPAGSPALPALLPDLGVPDLSGVPAEPVRSPVLGFQPSGSAVGATSEELLGASSPGSSALPALLPDLGVPDLSGGPGRSGVLAEPVASSPVLGFQSPGSAFGAASGRLLETSVYAPLDAAGDAATFFSSELARGRHPAAAFSFATRQILPSLVTTAVGHTASRNQFLDDPTADAAAAGLLSTGVVFALEPWARTGMPKPLAAQVLASTAYTNFVEPQLGYDQPPATNDLWYDRLRTRAVSQGAIAYGAFLAGTRSQGAARAASVTHALFEGIATAVTDPPPEGFRAGEFAGFLRDSTQPSRLTGALADQAARVEQERALAGRPPLVPAALTRARAATVPGGTAEALAGAGLNTVEALGTAGFDLLGRAMDPVLAVQRVVDDVRGVRSDAGLLVAPEASAHADAALARAQHQFGVALRAQPGSTGGRLARIGANVATGAGHLLAAGEDLHRSLSGEPLHLTAAADPLRLDRAAAALGRARDDVAVLTGRAEPFVPARASGPALEGLPVMPELVVVRRGDTLWQLAQDAGVSVSDLHALNRSAVPNPDLIHPGLVMRVR